MAARGQDEAVSPYMTENYEGRYGAFEYSDFSGLQVVESPEEAARQAAMYRQYAAANSIVSPINPNESPVIPVGALGNTGNLSPVMEDGMQTVDSQFEELTPKMTVSSLTRPNLAAVPSSGYDAVGALPEVSTRSPTSPYDRISPSSRFSSSTLAKPFSVLPEQEERSRYIPRALGAGAAGSAAAVSGSGASIAGSSACSIGDSEKELGADARGSKGWVMAGAVAGSRDKRKAGKICGVRRRIFFMVVFCLIVLIAAVAIATGVALSIKAKSNNAEAALSDNDGLGGNGNSPNGATQAPGSAPETSPTALISGEFDLNSSITATAEIPTPTRASNDESSTDSPNADNDDDDKTVQEDDNATQENKDNKTTQNNNNNNNTPIQITPAPTIPEAPPVTKVIVQTKEIIKTPAPAPAPSPTPAPSQPKTSAAPIVAPKVTCPSFNGKDVAFSSGNDFHIECDTDYSALHGAQDLRQVDTPDFNKCLQYCADESKCLGVGWSLYGGEHWRCWLKYKLGDSMILPSHYFAIHKGRT